MHSKNKNYFDTQKSSLPEVIVRWNLALSKPSKRDLDSAVEWRSIAKKSDLDGLTNHIA